MQTRKFGKLGSGDLLAKPQGNQSSSQSIAGSLNGHLQSRLKAPQLLDEPYRYFRERDIVEALAAHD